MALHLITGYAGSEHITSKDQGAYNMATFGSGNFVLDRGEKFKNAVASNNSITIYDGEAMLQGRFIKMPAGTTESVTIENGASGQTRNDLICIRYTKNTTDNTESASLVVIKGTPNGGDPSYNTGLITDGDANVSDFPLYRVSLNGINIASVTALFSVKVSMADYMDNYQMPNATSTSKGAVQIGSGINVSNGVISVPTPTPYSLPIATSDTLGGVKIGASMVYDNTKGLNIKNNFFGIDHRTPSEDITISANNFLNCQYDYPYKPSYRKVTGAFIEVKDYDKVFAIVTGFVNYEYFTTIKYTIVNLDNSAKTLNKNLISICISEITYWYNSNE